MIDSSGLKVFNAAGDMNIEFGIVNGYAVMRYYDNNGDLLYDLGPGGLMKLELRNAGWVSVPNMLRLGTSYSSILTANPQIYKNPMNASYDGQTYTYYRYQCKIVNGIKDPDTAQYDGVLFETANLLGTKVNGIYMIRRVSPMQMLTEGTNVQLGANDLDLWHTSNEAVYDNGYINMVSLREYILGKEYVTAKAYWNTYDQQAPIN